MWCHCGIISNRIIDFLNSTFVFQYMFLFISMCFSIWGSNMLKFVIIQDSKYACPRIFKREHSMIWSLPGGRELVEGIKLKKCCQIIFTGLRLQTAPLFLPVKAFPCNVFSKAAISTSLFQPVLLWFKIIATRSCTVLTFYNMIVWHFGFLESLIAVKVLIV